MEQGVLPQPLAPMRVVIFPHAKFQIQSFKYLPACRRQRRRFLTVNTFNGIALLRPPQQQDKNGPPTTDMMMAALIS